MKRHLPLFREKRKKEKKCNRITSELSMETKGFHTYEFFLPGKVMNGIQRNDLHIYYLESDDVYES